MMTSLKEILPLSITEEELEKYPQFVNLLNQLGDKITPNGMSQHMQKALEMAQNNVSWARLNWLTNCIIYHELQELLADLEIREIDGSLSQDERQLRQIFSKTLAFSEIPDFLHYLPNRASKSILFGMSEEDIKRHNPVKHHLSAIQQIVLPMLEDNLSKKCEELYTFFDPLKNQEVASSQLLMAKSQSLPAFVEKKKQDLEQEKEQLKKERMQRDVQFWSYYQKLLECLSVMETLLKDYKLQTQVSTDEAFVDWLKVKSDALCLKVRVTQLQILCDTYNKETVKALKKIGVYLDGKVKQTEKELASISQSLQAYHAIGADFKSLVEEFTKLQLEIENRKWGLRKLTNEDTEKRAVGDVSSSSSKTSDILERAIIEVGKANSNKTGTSEARASTFMAPHTQEDKGREATPDHYFYKRDCLRQKNTMPFDQMFDVIQERDETSPS